jgi:hypothetical protein
VVSPTRKRETHAQAVAKVDAEADFKKQKTQVLHCLARSRCCFENRFPVWSLQFTLDLLQQFSWW